MDLHYVEMVVVAFEQERGELRLFVSLYGIWNSAPA